MNNIKIILSFIAGAAIGSTATYFVVKKKYETRINNEVRDAKEYYEKKYAYDSPCEDSEVPTEGRPKEYEEVVAETKPPKTVNTDLTRYDRVKKQILNENKPFEIDADTYNYASEFNKRIFVYCTDSFLVDEDGNAVKNIISTVGLDMVDKIKDPNIETMYIRNEKSRCDYMISKQNCTFAKYQESLDQCNIPEGSKAPYVINIDQWEDTGDYRKENLTLYSDGILADDDGVIYNLNHVIGLSSLGRFGEFEENTVFVRNEGLDTDYAVYKESSKYKISFPDTLV